MEFLFSHKSLTHYIFTGGLPRGNEAVSYPQPPPSTRALRPFFEVHSLEMVEDM